MERRGIVERRGVWEGIGEGRGIGAEGREGGRGWDVAKRDVEYGGGGRSITSSP